MNRRDLIRTAGLTVFYANLPVVLSELLVACQSGEHLPHLFFTDKEFTVLEEMIDILLPATATPGGRELQVPAFIDKIVAECLRPGDQEELRRGIQELEQEGSAPFDALKAEEKHRVLTVIDQGAFKGESRYRWFHTFKKTALIGYFTSQKGMTEALNYVKVPGEYLACIPYKPSDKAMAKTFLMY